MSGRNKEDRRDESKVVKKVEKEVENDVYSVGTGSLFTLKKKKKEKEKIGNRTECGKQFI